MYCTWFYMVFASLGCAFVDVINKQVDRGNTEMRLFLLHVQATDFSRISHPFLACDLNLKAQNSLKRNNPHLTPNNYLCHGGDVCSAVCLSHGL